jgi:hypothetical protein
MYYILYFFLDNVSSTCLGCYLHPLSGAQLQRRFCMVWRVIALEQVLVWNTFTLKHGQLQTVCNWPCLSVRVSQTSTCSNGITHQTIQNYGCTLLLCSWWWVQIAPETFRANVVKKEIKNIVHLFGLELNTYVTKMYGTTNIKIIYITNHNI